MRTTIIFAGLVLLVGCLYGQTNTVASKQEPIAVKIQWVSNLPGNFSFKKKWSYPDGIYRNKYVQLVCDAFCPPETAAMTDSSGKIFKDSLRAFYNMVDTSHQYFSIFCKAWCYEWNGTNFIEVARKSVDSVFCYTLMNAATHCSLQLNIVNNNCYAITDLNSVAEKGSRKFFCQDGYIFIDKKLWSKGTLKAIFRFNFRSDNNMRQPVYWTGKIYTLIKQKS